MGYYSQLEALVYGPPDELDRYMAADALTTKHLAAVPSEWWSIVKFTIMRMKARDTRKGAKVEWEGVEVKAVHFVADGKLYDDYPEVQGMMGFIRGVGPEDDASDGALDYEFIRVGEDEGDLEREASSGFEVLYTAVPPIEHNIDLEEWEQD